MKREIKFRAWDSKSKKMLESFDVSQDGYVGIVNMFETHEPIYDAVLLQYTGQKDKNGKEIYEGDIIEALSLFKLTPEFKIKGKILFNERGYWVAEEINPKYSEQEYLYELTKQDGDGTIRCEIIGNIYEHPHLLTQ